MRVISLLYHDVFGPAGPASSGFAGAGADRYKLSQDEFASHLEAIRSVLPHAPARISDVLGSARAHKPAVLLTFDDGGASADFIAGSLERFGWRGHFFVTTGFVGTPTFLSRQQIRSMHQRGHVIGSHSQSHPPRMAASPAFEVVREWKESTAALEDILGSKVTVASIPCGSYARRVAEAAAEAGIHALFTSEPTATTWSVHHTLVLGRYSIFNRTDAATAAALARGALLPCLSQKLVWNAKKAAKRAAADTYLKAREGVLRRIDR